jgi:hypothetical protein
MTLIIIEAVLHQMFPCAAQLHLRQLSTKVISWVSEYLPLATSWAPGMHDGRAHLLVFDSTCFHDFLTNLYKDKDAYIRVW